MMMSMHIAVVDAVAVPVAVAPVKVPPHFSAAVLPIDAATSLACQPPRPGAHSTCRRSRLRKKLPSRTKRMSPGDDGSAVDDGSIIGGDGVDGGDGPLGGGYGGSDFSSFGSESDWDEASSWLASLGPKLEFAYTVMSFMALAVCMRYSYLRILSILLLKK